MTSRNVKLEAVAHPRRTNIQEQNFARIRIAPFAGFGERVVVEDQRLASLDHAHIAVEQIAVGVLWEDVEKTHPDQILVGNREVFACRRISFQETGP